MKLQIWVSTMGMADGALPARLGVAGQDVAFVDQCGRDGCRLVPWDGRLLPVAESAARGLSRSRNLALDRADGDLLWMIDDDLTLDPACEERVLAAFAARPEADAIAFNVVSETPDRPQRLFTEERPIALRGSLRLPTYRFVYRLARLREKGLRFREEFGSGSVYTSGEDSIFTADCLRAGLRLVAVPAEIARVRHTDSGWFSGYTDKYLFDKGAVLRAIFGRKAGAACAAMLLRHPEWRGERSLPAALGLMLQGAREYAGKG